MISKNGFWLDDTLENHHFDTDLCNGLFEFLKKEKAETLYDFGCGHGLYTKTFNQSGIKCQGFDGNPNTKELTNSECEVLDLSQPQQLPTHDWVMSLEVGEHIPKEFENNFINNLHIHNTKGIILSWAIPGQGGHGHYNEQPNEYIKNKLISLGYTNDMAAEETLRRASSHWWFKSTIMVFRKNDRV